MRFAALAALCMCLTQNPDDDELHHAARAVLWIVAASCAPSVASVSSSMQLSGAQSLDVAVSKNIDALAASLFDHENFCSWLSKTTVVPGDPHLHASRTRCAVHAELVLSQMRLPHITTIDVPESCQLDDSGFVRIAAQLPRSNLTALSLSACAGISDTALDALVVALSQSSSMLALTLPPEVSPRRRAALACELQLCLLRQQTPASSPHTVVLCDCGYLNDVAVMRIAQAVQQLSSVTTIDLSWTQMSDQGARALVEAIRINKSIMYVHTNEFGGGVIPSDERYMSITARPEFSSDSFEEHAVRERRNPDLLLPRFGRAVLAVMNVELLFNRLHHFPSSPLNASRLFLDTSAVIRLCQTLTHHVHCPELELDPGIVLAPEGVHALIDVALTTNTHMTRLNMLPVRQLHSVGLDADATPTSSVLMLTGTGVNDLFACVLAPLLSHCTHITCVRLNNNSIGDSGALELCRVLRSNTIITELDLSFNLLSDAAVLDLCAMVKENPTSAILRLNVCCCFVL
jgi:hypothetical protein